MQTTAPQVRTVRPHQVTTRFQSRPGTGMPPRRVTSGGADILGADGRVLATISTTNGDHSVRIGLDGLAPTRYWGRDWDEALRVAHREIDREAALDEMFAAHDRGDHELWRTLRAAYRQNFPS